MRWVLQLAMMLLIPPSLSTTIFASPSDTLGSLPPDSLQTQPTSPFQQVTATRIDSVLPSYTSTKSPGLAMLFSGLLPGAGQVYNESYWKVPIVLGFGVYFASEWLNYNRRAEDAREKYQASLETIPGGDGLQFRLREFYKDRRDTFAWYFLILYLVNVADAYVDASLYDFDVGGDLSLRLTPDARNRLSLQLRF